MEILHIPNPQNQPPWMVLYLIFFPKGQAAMKVDVFSPQKMGMSFFLLILGMQSVQTVQLECCKLDSLESVYPQGFEPSKRRPFAFKTRVIWLFPKIGVPQNHPF